LDSIRLSGTRVRRMVVAAVLLLLTLTFIVLPAGAGQPPPPSSTTTITSSNGCSFTVTYTWQGFHGKGLIAVFGLYERLNGLDASYNLFSVPGVSGKSGSVSHTFNFTGTTTSRTVLFRGALQNGRTFAQVSGSTSGTGLFASDCANPTSP